MAIPVISSTQSVLGYAQWEQFEFQPYATGNPIRWQTNNPLPAGLALDDPEKFAYTGATATDLISCAASFVDGDQVVLWTKTGGTGVTVETIYYARDVVAATSLKLAATPGGAVVALGSDISAGVLSRKPTGMISGAAQVPGVRVIGLVAGNADGDSAEVEFTLGIEPGALVPDSLPWLAVNVFTGQLMADGVEVPPLTNDILANLGKNTPGFDPPFALAVKEGDDLLSRISFVRGETVQDISLDALRLVIKEYEPESVLGVSTEAFEKQGTGTGTNFLLHAKFSGSALAAALSNYEEDKGTFFYALAEIEYTQVNPESVGPATLVRSSATFIIRIERDIADNVVA